MGHVTRAGEMRYHKILVSKLEGKRSSAKLIRWWEDNIHMDHKWIWWLRVHWIHVAQDSGGRCEDGNEIPSSITGEKILSNWATLSFSRKILFYGIYCRCCCCCYCYYYFQEYKNYANFCSPTRRSRFHTPNPFKNILFLLLLSSSSSSSSFFHILGPMACYNLVPAFEAVGCISHSSSA